MVTADSADAGIVGSLLSSLHWSLVSRLHMPGTSQAVGAGISSGPARSLAYHQLPPSPSRHVVHTAWSGLSTFRFSGFPLGTSRADMSAFFTLSWQGVALLSTTNHCDPFCGVFSAQPSVEHPRPLCQQHWVDGSLICIKKHRRRLRRLVRTPVGLCCSLARAPACV